jgi:hypothetical protein
MNSAEVFWYTITIILVMIIVTIIAKHNDPREGMESINNIRNAGGTLLDNLKNSAAAVTNAISGVLQPKQAAKVYVWQDPGAISMDPELINKEIACTGEEERDDYVGSRECRGASYGFAGCGKASRVPGAELVFDAIGELTTDRIDPDELNSISDCNGDTHTAVYSYTEPTGCPYT